MELDAAMVQTCTNAPCGLRSALAARQSTNCPEPCSRAGKWWSAVPAAGH